MAKGAESEAVVIRCQGGDLLNGWFAVVGFGLGVLSFLGALCARVPTTVSPRFAINAVVLWAGSAIYGVVWGCWWASR